MRTIFILVAAISVCFGAHADPALLGKWRSDRELTMSFAEERAKLEDKTMLFLKQMVGLQTITFTATQVRSEMPNWESTTADGLTSKLIGFDETHPYKRIGTTANQVAVASQEPVTGRTRITVYNFEDEDTMWVYLGGAPFPQMNIREYFVRAK